MEQDEEFAWAVWDGLEGRGPLIPSPNECLADDETRCILRQGSTDRGSDIARRPPGRLPCGTRADQAGVLLSPFSSVVRSCRRRIRRRRRRNVFHLRKCLTQSAERQKNLTSTCLS